MAEQPEKTAMSAPKPFWSRVAAQLDRFLDSLYRYRGSYAPPLGINEPVWNMPPDLPYPWLHRRPDGGFDPADYYLHYFQSQGYGPTQNECVTTSALISMNMLKDRAALSHGHPLASLPDRNLEDYTHDLDGQGWRGWRYRFSTRSWLPGMMTPWQAVQAIRDHIASLEKDFGGSFRIKLSAWNTLDDLIAHLKRGDMILIHGAWAMTLDRGNTERGYNPLLAWLGGMPHTMLLIGYDGGAAHWLLLNPADPWFTNRANPSAPRLFRMSTQQLLDFWGRQFLFYPPRFAITVIASQA